MALFIENVLDSHTLDAILEALNDEGVFEDGKSTASGIAKQAKQNVQAKSDASLKAVVKMIEQTLLKNALFQAAAIPLKFAKTRINRYDSGMHYGAHVDDAFMGGVRTDLSFTLFLSDPDTYDGGELIVRRNDGDESIKLPKGALYLYPSTSVHHVLPVRCGSRLAAVGWVQSRVKSEQQRQLLFDLSSAIKQLPTEDANLEARLKLLNAKNNLLRMWAD